MVKSEVHIHTKYGDGINTPEEMIEAALKKGYTLLGFSEHSPIPGEKWAMKETDEPYYREEIAALKEKYKDRITILCGLELDSFSEPPKEKYDFIIGSVHGIEKGRRIWDVDASVEQMEELVELFSGNAMNLAEAYFEEVSKVLDKTHGDIIGHFDLINKWEKIHPFFSIDHPRYRAAAEDAVKALIPYGVPFEVNTGAIARGYRASAYPVNYVMRAIHERGGDMILSSDCHDAKKLGIGFEDALKRIRAAGFERLAVRTATGFDYIDINKI